ncbi:hypothetical protein PBY51_002513 [Eleginops maclovinus]|uniref:Uncharacterized protein n=1 Tax=Eleginops maclovinus TaxID=56733 RepID=A0AAN7XCD8_ELEMC|nr:hypothetical protein PBY51_002513 [Eleginops maclovinus]
MGPSTSTPGGSRRLTQSHAVMESASHHRNPNATAHFHGLAEKRHQKQENHTRSLECSSIYEKPQLEVPILKPYLWKARGKTGCSWKRKKHQVFPGTRKYSR